jgi:nicotinamide-nucleotide amidase
MPEFISLSELIKEAKPVKKQTLAVIVCIGTEIAQGKFTDTNTPFIRQALKAIGIETVMTIAVGDDQKALFTALHAATSLNALVVTTGGLGPTFDDLTRTLLSEVTGLPLCLHEPTVDKIAEIFVSREIINDKTKLVGVDRENAIRQANILAGACIIENHKGTAPGMIVPLPNGGMLVSLPGPPKEMQPMFDKVVSILMEIQGTISTYEARWKIIGGKEPVIASLLERFTRENREIVLSILFNEKADLTVGLTCQVTENTGLKDTFDRIRAEITQVLEAQPGIKVEVIA